MTKNENRQLTKIIIIIVLISFAFGGLSSLAESGNRSRKESKLKQEHAESQKAVQEKQPKLEQPLTEEPIERITNILKSKYHKFEVSIYNREFKDAMPGNGPWEVIANTPVRGLGSCTDAKRVTFEAIRAIYLDPIAEANILRVRVNALPFSSASLGVDDGKSLSDDLWKSNGPTNFIKSLEASGTQESDVLPVEQATFWLERTGCA